MSKKHKDEELKEEIKEECNCQEECCCEEENCDEKKCNCQDDKNAEIENLNNQILALKEALLRNQADLQNYKRRKEEEAEKVLKYKNEDLIKELLGIVDNFERAILLDDENLEDELSKFLSGFKMIYTNLVNILNTKGVSEIECQNQVFDPNTMQAVLTDKVEGIESGHVIEVLQKGYIYNEKVIRPAMVKVNE